MERLRSIQELAELRRSLRAELEAPRPVVRICTTGCRAYGAEAVARELEAELRRRGVEAEVRRTGCHGFCARAPVMALDPGGIFYQQVSPEDVPEIVERTVLRGELVERLLYQGVARQEEVPFWRAQVRRVLRNCGVIDPRRVEHYIARGGYAALERALSMSPQAVIEAVKRSGLRGRGGAGFPTGLKWELCRQAPGDLKYLVCNADEGDPGAFMDRAVLEGDPHAVLEGMLIAAHAIGARRGYIYVRAEYPIAVEHLRVAVDQARQLGLLGEDVLGTGLCFELEIKEGAGAFVCGEETALLASIEGRRGMPRPRPPFPAQRGLEGRPTNINNVETFANVPLVILEGPERYAALGTERSKGTKVFSLAGRVQNTGLVEVPMGTSIRQIVFEVGGGIPRGRRFKAVQMGGPSGGCVPEQYLDRPVDYDSLQEIGAIMGSGGMVVMDENTCMVEIARFFLSFTQSESCGKCAPCRLGTKQMLEILGRITRGEGAERDLRLLERIAEVVRDVSLCGLGQTCPKPVLSTLRYFREEYEAHILDKRCPACVCEPLMISPCQHACPAGVDVPAYVAAIAAGEYERAVEIIRERNPFPSICGRICHHPCEVKCRRGELDEPVAIRALKRFVADWYFEHHPEPPPPFPVTRPQRVAVVGAGPTGLSCAYFLARMGYRVTVFEALDVAGGMLAVAVPQFRLPREVIQREVEYIQARGVEIRYRTPIDVNYTVDDLRREGYEAVFIAAGAQKSQRVGIPGEAEGVEGLAYGLSFLRDVKLGRPPRVGRRVVVIGGGNTAFDAARTALRLGAQEVHLLYRRSREEMPVTDREYREALAEGVKVHFLVNPTRILRDNGRVRGVECVRMQLGEADESGRRRPLPIPGTEFLLEADMVIPAVGQAPDPSFLPPDTNLERTRWGTLVVDPNRLSTNVPGVFAGGDFVTGPDFLIYAIAAGRRAALAIDRYLRGDPSRVRLHETRAEAGPRPPLREEPPEERAQERPPELPMAHRLRGFGEIELSLSEEQARREAQRCLRCDLER